MQLCVARNFVLDSVGHRDVYLPVDARELLLAVDARYLAEAVLETLEKRVLLYLVG